MSSSTKFQKPRVEIDRSPTRCPYCHENVRLAEDAWVVCAECLARHHKECWQDALRCSACGQTGCLEPASMTQFRAPARPAAITERLSRSLPTLVVAKRGGGDFTTIGEAVRAARAGTKIIVAAGTYHESVVIDRPLALIGRGSVDEIVVESNGQDCIVMETDQAMVRGMTLRARAGLGSHASHATVTVTKGVLRLWDCDVASDSLWPCVQVRGTGDPLVRRCKIHGGQGGAVLVSEHGRGTFEDCEIHGFRGYGVGVKTGARPTFARCAIHAGPVGVFVDENGHGSFRDCEVWNTTDAGVRVTMGAAPIFSSCKIHDCGAGVHVHESGEGTFEECTITASKKTNVLVERAGNPLFRRSKLDRSLGAGVTISASGLGRFDDCTINENALQGVEVSLGADPTFERTKIRRNGKTGVWIRHCGRGTFEGCDLTQNDAGPWQLDGKCQVHRRENRE